MLPKRITDLHGQPVAAFIRVSTDQQQLSPANQRRAIEGFARDNGLRIVRTEDLTISGSIAYRDPAVLDLLDAAEQGTIRAVVVATLDRMGRSSQTDIFIDELHKAGAVLIDAGNEMVSGNRAHRRSMRTGIATAGNERDLISERVSNGIRGKWEGHRDPWGFPAYGYVRQPAPEAEKCHDECSHRILTIDATARDTVTALFERYASGTVSFDTLAEDAPIVATGRYAGQRMTREGLASMLANDLYAGVVRHGGNTAHRPDLQIVSDDLWNTVQRIREQRAVKAGHKAPDGRVLLFDGIYHCANCGVRLTFDGKGGTPPRQRVRHKNPCPEWGRKERKSDTLWADALIAQITSMEVSEAVAADVVAVLNGGRVTDNIAPLRFLRERRQIADALVARTISATDADERLRRIDEAEAEAHQTAPEPSVTPEAVLDALHDLGALWRDADQASRAQMVKAIYAKVPVRSDGTFGEVELTPEATRRGLLRALPETVPVRVGWRAREE